MTATKSFGGIVPLEKPELPIGELVERLDDLPAPRHLTLVGEDEQVVQRSLDVHRRNFVLDHQVYMNIINGEQRYQGSRRRTVHLARQAFRGTGVRIGPFRARKIARLAELDREAA